MPLRAPMLGVEAADFDCARCGATWTAAAAIRPGGHALVDMACPSCGLILGGVRCDDGVPTMERRAPNAENLGILRVYAGDKGLAMLGRPR